MTTEISKSMAPIAVFAYKRPKELAAALDALKRNYDSNLCEVYLFSDGPGKEEDKDKVNKVRKILDEVTGFKVIHRIYAESNQGLATSVIKGVSMILQHHPNVIVLEDDLLASPNFLDFMNQCLNNYTGNKQVFSISGYSLPFKKPNDYAFDAYTFPRTGSWGWATWSDRWILAEWQVSDYERFKADGDAQRKFNEGGSDRVRMLRRQQQGIINSWAIRWCYSQFKYGGYTVYPTESKIQNIGFSEDSTNTNVYNRYKTKLDDGKQRTFNLPSNVIPIEAYIKQFQFQYSLPVRIFNRLKTYAGLRM